MSGAEPNNSERLVARIVGGEPNNSERLVARIVGPGDPEVSCEQCFEQLDRYVELELAGADADAALPGMRAHFRGCSACAEDRESLRSFLVDHVGARSAETQQEGGSR
jgi:hypothetical protein